VTTSTLTDEGGKKTLEIECDEEGFIARTFVEEGKEIKVNALTMLTEGFF
jgi:pyruvate/2-oxoglutarate dehydrogenase complex dihydrolipoamide acyltransferase (E2) component